MYYQAVREDRPVLVVVETDSEAVDPIEDYWESPAEGKRPVFVLTNHSRYSLGDKNAERIAWNRLQLSPAYRENWTFTRDLPGLVKAARRCKSFVWPVYLYSHSGHVLSLKPFSDDWDSGVLGVILWTREDALSVCADEAEVRRVMEGYFTEYKNYVQGEVYYVNVIDPSEPLALLKARKWNEDDEVELSDLSSDELQHCAALGESLDSVGGVHNALEAIEDMGVTEVEELYVDY